VLEWLTCLVSSPDLDKFGFFDNAPNHAVGFWGVYATRSLPHNTSLDLYYLGLDRKEATFERGTAQEVRHSLGGRISRPIATERPGWDFDYEALWQFGSFGPDSIRAWTVATETGYRFTTVRLKPRLSTKADISSGDNPNSKTLGTFNPLFPKGNYFGVLATTGPDPINFIDVHPRVEAALPYDVSVSFDWIVQWRENVNDSVYAVPGFLIRAADGSRARFVGHRPGTEVHWQANRHLWFQADYGIFYAGRFLKETQPGRNLIIGPFGLVTDSGRSLMSAADVLLKPEECVMSSIHFQARLAADSSLPGGLTCAEKSVQ
jgi:hypothetical protein